MSQEGSIQAQAIHQSIGDLRVDLAELKGEIHLTNQRLDAVISTLVETQKNRKWVITTAISALMTAGTLIYFIIAFRFG